VTLRVREHELGLSWVVEEPLERASHALVADGRVWFVDPVADDAVLARAAGLGEPAGVIRLLDRHGRDSDDLAASLGVPLYPLPEAIPDSPFEVVRVLHVPGWHEQALWWPERRALVVAEVVGSSPHYTLGGGRAAGIHPMIRLRPPGAPRRYQPEHLLRCTARRPPPRSTTPTPARARTCRACSSPPRPCSARPGVAGARRPRRAGIAGGHVRRLRLHIGGKLGAGGAGDRVDSLPEPGFVSRPRPPAAPPAPRPARTRPCSGTR
jgi:hypothetical protein